MIDKGRAKARCFCSNGPSRKGSGDLIGAVTQTIFCRGDGGFGGPPREAPPPHPIPARAPDAVCDLRHAAGDGADLSAQRRLQSAACRACFRQSGRLSAPILHGSATFGVSGHALLKPICGYDPVKAHRDFRAVSAPVFPGEDHPHRVFGGRRCLSFRARVVGRHVIVIDNGRAEVT